MRWDREWEVFEGGGCSCLDVLGGFMFKASGYELRSRRHSYHDIQITSCIPDPISLRRAEPSKIEVCRYPKPNQKKAKVHPM
ncbi:hypothetical protein VTJ04DRAFT_10400 [Mycothermus thermophilus]|uniref:uncharacterized protein n=1 Tax=Humicola insolens TaxID=85995 RepID=UPI003742D281